MSIERFSVYQFFPDGSWERYCRFVPVEQAMNAARALARSVGAQMGTTRRVIITDDGDSIAWEWKFGEGITFPKPEDITP